MIGKPGAVGCWFRPDPRAIVLVMSKTPFSKRNQYAGTAKEIAIREDAPENLRFTVLETARQIGWGPSALRLIVCQVLRVRPDSNNWSEYPNIWQEVQDLAYGCAWFKVYDIIEALYKRIAEYDRDNGEENAPQFADEINSFFVEEGIGWQLLNGEIVLRGGEAFESAVKTAKSLLEETGRPTAGKHIHEALQALSRRPEPNLHGAVYHAAGSLECLARDITGDEKATLGEILKRHSELVPAPLDRALSQVWGYASNEARHVAEGREPERDEAELLVGLAATVATYLSRKFGNCTGEQG